MRRLVRENALCVLAAAIASTVMGWLGLYGFAWNDYEIEAKPALEALVHGHVLNFFKLAPAYGGSLVLRAPFALLTDVWGGGELAVYRMVALPCLLAGAVLGVWLCAKMRAAGRPLHWRVVVMGICLANPLTLKALELGHPEELLGACLCIAAVLLAHRDRPLWAGFLLGLAIANKEWALLAAGPVLLALPRTVEDRAKIGGPRLRIWAQAAQRQIVCLASASVACMAVLAPLVLASERAFTSGTSGVASTGSTIFQPWQVWWFLGWHGALIRQLGVALPGYRTGPGWTGAISHPLIVLVGLVLAVALWLKRGREARAIDERDALLLLSLVLLLRCLLDTWDTGYYMLPALLTMLAWDVLDHRNHRPPILALVVIVLPWLGLQALSARYVSPDLRMSGSSWNFESGLRDLTVRQ